MTMHVCSFRGNRHERRVPSNNGVQQWHFCGNVRQISAHTPQGIIKDKRETRIEDESHQTSPAGVGGVDRVIGGDKDNARVEIAAGTAAVSRVRASAADICRKIDGYRSMDRAGGKRYANGAAIKFGGDARIRDCNLAGENLGHIGATSNPDIGVRVQVKHLQKKGASGLGVGFTVQDVGCCD